MKRIVVLVAALLMASLLWSQSPEKMSYQSVVRDASNALVTNQAVGMQLSILQGTIGGTAVYVEAHSPTANVNGLVSIELGSGTIVSGDFTIIDWSAGPYFIKTEIDPLGGTTYTITGTNQLMSVPYALYAKTSGNGDGVDGIDGIDGIDGATGPQGPAGASSLLEDADADTKIQVEESANEDIIRFDIEGTERWVMQGARLEPTNTGNSLFIGQGAGANDDLTDNENVFVGNSAGYSNTTGNYNTANGYEALYFNTTGYGNTANGYVALYSNTTGTQNTANGFLALFSNTTGSLNAANGRSALYSNTTGNRNTANGYEALYSNTTGDLNAANGSKALYSNTTGNYNTANGYQALYSNTTGSNNTALGYYANVAAVDLTNATAIGAYATVNASNKIQLGDANVTAINTSGTYTGAGFVKAGGTATEFLMADGTVSIGIAQTLLISGDTLFISSGNYILIPGLSLINSLIVNGCIDATALNYDASANTDDGSCIVVVNGCMDPTACNYNSAANVDDTSCTYLEYYIPTDYTVSTNAPMVMACEAPEGYELADQVCAEEFILNDPYCLTTDWNLTCQTTYNCCTNISGCTDPEAYNFDPAAGCDDGSCIAVVNGCMDPTAFNYNALANTDDGSCIATVGDLRDGGIVFWVDPADYTHGKVCALADATTFLDWADAISYSNSYTNSDTGTGVYSNWYLPSKDELNLMWLNIGQGNALGLGNVGDFTDGSYWSSTVHDINERWSQGFYDGFQYGYFEYSTNYVRAVRAF
jgi:hypothetical protein